ncbi:histidinol-phosphate transaminase [Candidatus Uabimicrobium sp. HlEnr_7]|uniref:histidinol-phosphate transaminase n=1 Tax=Candidatus Uabimicrobium helgolandensis TaxID=3095367 RepID=UPI0035560BFF
MASTIIKLNANENPLGASPQVINSLNEITQQLHRYPTRNDRELCKVLAEHYSNDLTHDYFCVGNSACEMIELITRVFLDKESQVIVCPPTFHIYEKMAKNEKAQVIKVPLEQENFNYNIKNILDAITSKTRLLFICSPNNPTGSVLSVAQLDNLLQKIPQHVMVVADEVYKHYTTDNDLMDTLLRTKLKRNLFVVHSFSKAYGLAGLRLGYVVAHPSLIQKIRAFYRTFHLSSLAIVAGITALKDQQHLRKSIDLAKEQRTILYRELQNLGVDCWPSKGNFILIKPKNCDEMYEYFQQHNILVNPTFKSGLPGGLRISLGLPEHNRIFIHTLKQYLQRSSKCKS